MPAVRKIKRLRHLERIKAALKAEAVVSLFGPRQCGKTSLVRGLATRAENYFDLYDYEAQAILAESRFSVLDRLTGTVVINEAQLMPELFLRLRILADRPKRPARFILIGSASGVLSRGISESLAGRVRLLPISGFDGTEVGWESWQELWVRGGYPRAYLHDQAEDSLNWRLDYISQFVGRDLRMLADTKLSDEQLRRLLQMIANYHGQYWNHSQAAELIGVNYKTVQRHLEIFKGAFIIRELPAFFRNSSKRLRAGPKIYLRDSGLLHALLLVRDYQQLMAHPILGASWEGFGVEQVITLSEAREGEFFTWSVQGGAELDLVIVRPQGRYGFEFKASVAPKRTKSMVSALENLALEKLFVVHPGVRSYVIDDKIEAIGITDLMRAISQMS